jgi:hypothetical protein
MQHRRFLQKHAGLMKINGEINRLAAYWTHWNQMCERASSNRPYLRVQLEEIDSRLNEISDFFGINITLHNEHPRNIKSSYGVRPMPSAQLPKATIKLAASYGYDSYAFRD